MLFEKQDKMNAVNYRVVHIKEVDSEGMYTWHYYYPEYLSKDGKWFRFIEEGCWPGKYAKRFNNEKDTREFKLD